jgi:hypothetical protein
MPSLDKRMIKLEETLEQHLIESGQIRADLSWLKKAYWTLAGLGIAFAGAGATAAFEFLFRMGK